MPESNRRRTAAAIALTAGITASAALLLSACGSHDPHASGPSSTAPVAPPTGSAAGSAAGSGRSGARPVGSAAPLNGTAVNGLTISDGSRFVVMNGTRVDFGTEVRDLTWSPDGSKAVFVDGDGDLVISNPDGSGRVVVAKNPGGVTWSHPTWEHRTAVSEAGMPALDDILFAAGGGSSARLYSVHASDRDATAKVLPLSAPAGNPALPQSGNLWPSAAGSDGKSVYAHIGPGEVYLRDDNLRQQGYGVSPGSEPALSPTDENGAIVFVRSVDGHDHLYLEEAGSGEMVYKDLTPHATTNYAEPAWSPDGRTIAARTPEGIVTLPANGTAAPVKVSDYHGLPAYRPS